MLCELSIMMKNTPLDLKFVSIFLFCSAFSFLEVNTNYNYFLGNTVTGYFSKLIWAISSIVCAVGAFGLWTRNLKILHITIAYFFLSLANFVLWYLFIPLKEKALIIQTEGAAHSLNQTTTTVFFFGFTLIQILFIVYLLKRKSIFK